MSDVTGIIVFIQLLFSLLPYKWNLVAQLLAVTCPPGVFTGITSLHRFEYDHISARYAAGKIFVQRKSAAGYFGTDDFSIVTDIYRQP